jgi:2-methylcitrate dehydratase PrpD
MTAVTRELARFVSEIRFDSLPAEVSERAKALALDLTGIMLRARHDAESTPPMFAAAAQLGLACGAAR